MLKYLLRQKLIKVVISLCIFFFSVTSTFAQIHKPVYNLLWKISGNGLTKPSYLFGTMHVTDKRVFNFSDSVMLSLSKCSSFALEVQPDSLMKELFANFQQNDTTRNLLKLLGEKKYAAFAKRFKEKNGYALRDDINPFVAESLMSDGHSKPGDEQTFVDGYLYGIARTMNKNILGLENTAQQFNKLNNDTDEIKAKLEGLLEDGGYNDNNSEEMIKIYSTGNIDAVMQYMGDAMNDSDLVSRNKVMAGSITRYLNNGPLFSAVGAAHLPGDNGVISLLKQAGYTLTPVEATFTGVAAKYKIDYNKIKWVTHTNNQFGYSLQFPSEPIQANIAGINTTIYSDLANETFYGIYTLKKGTKSNPANREQVISNLLSNITKNKKCVILSKKNTIVNGLIFTNIIMKTGGTYQRSAFIVDNNILYYLYAGNHLKSINDAAADRFFNSFRSFKVADKEESNWIAFKNDTGAFSVKIPAAPTRLNKETPNTLDKNGPPFRFNIFFVSDTARLVNYIIRYNDYPTGTYLADNKAMFEAMIKELGTKGEIIGLPDTIWKDGYEGRQVKFTAAGHYYCIAQIYTRGNRVYFLLEQNIHEDEPLDPNSEFFSSFKFIPYLTPDLTYFEPEGADYKIKFPAQPKIIKDTINDYSSYLQNYATYYSTSPTSGGVYTFEHAIISKYYRTDSLENLYKDIADKLITYRDSITKTDTISINNKPGKELISVGRYSNEQKRSRILVDGKDVFIITGRLAKEELFDETSNDYYSSLVYKAKDTVTDIFSSKAQMITAGLQSDDTLTYKKALGAFDYYKFKLNELPFIYTALQKNYIDDTTTTGARNKMVDVLKTIHDNNSIQQLLTIYPDLKGKDELKANILGAIPEIDKQKGYDIYFKLLMGEEPLKLHYVYYLFKPLSDSLDYTAAHYGQIVPLINIPAYTSKILMLTTSMLAAKKPAYDKVIKDKYALLTKDCFKELDNFLTSKDTLKYEWNTNISNYLEIMSRIKNEPLADKFTSYYMKKNPKGAYFSNAVIARIDNHLYVNPLIVSRLMDSIDSRYEVMEALYNQKQLTVIPFKYKKQDEFGKLGLYKFISSDDDEGTPGKITLLGSIQQNKLIYYVYKFTLPERADDVSYIGIAGGFKPGPPTLNFENYLGYTEYEEKKANWQKQAKKLIESQRAQKNYK